MRKLLAVAVALAACSKTPAPAATGGVTADSIMTPLGRAHALAMIDPGGQAPVDLQIRKLQAYLQTTPDKEEAWLDLGQAWIVDARETAKPVRYANAGACADILLGMQPDNRLALELQGLVMMNDHRFEDARAIMETVTKRWPQDPIAWGTLSDALLDLGRTQEAIAAAQQMVDLKPNLPSYSRAAHLQWLLGDVAAAKDTLRLAIDAGGDGKDHEPKAWVLVQAAMIFWNEGDYEGAEAGFDQALKTMPDFPPALVGKARVLIGRGDGKSAIPLLEKAYKANPLIDTGWLLGDARTLAGDDAGAQAAWAALEQHGREIDPRTLAIFLAAKDLQHQDALQIAEEERKVRDDEYTEDAYAWALYRLGPTRLDEALAASDRATKLGTRDARLWYHAGAIRIAKGDAQGREWIKKALALNPHFDRTGELEARKLLGGTN